MILYLAPEKSNERSATKGDQHNARGDERRALMVFFVIAFAAAATAGVFGALLNKVAPIG